MTDWNTLGLFSFWSTPSLKIVSSCHAFIYHPVGVSNLKWPQDSHPLNTLYVPVLLNVGGTVNMIGYHSEIKLIVI